MPGVSFRPLSEADLSTVTAWLAQDHVRAWWPEPQGDAAVRAKYLPRIRGEEPTAMFIVTWNDRDVGLIQSYRLADHPQWAATINDSGQVFPMGAGIDYLIGEPDLVGRGLGTEVIAEFTRSAFEAYPEVDAIVVTPQEANEPSCRVLERNGYELVWTGLLDSDDPSDAGTAAMYVRRR